MAIPWQLRIVIIMNRKADLNLLVHAATESIQQWAPDIKGMHIGILIVIHSFGADMKWHPHIYPVEFPNGTGTYSLLFIWILKMDAVCQTHIIGAGGNQTLINPMVAKIALLSNAFMRIKVNRLIRTCFDT